MSKIMAHRGARNLWAENSLLGFRNILPHGFDAVEFDVHLTDAGELAVIHDATLERTTDATGPVRALTPEARRATRLRGPDGALTDEHVPTLEEVLALLSTDPDIEPWIELKSDPDGHPYPGLVARAVEAVTRHGMENRAALHSFDISVVEDIRRTAPHMRRLISVNAEWADRQGGIVAFLRRVDDLVDVVGIHHALFEAEFDTIAALRRLKHCSVWTVNEPDLIQRWLARAPGFVVSDDPVLVQVLQRESRAA